MNPYESPKIVESPPNSIGNLIIVANISFSLAFGVMSYLLGISILGEIAIATAAVNLLIVFAREK